MPDTPHLSETSSEILLYLSSVRYQLSEMLLTFFHTILTWNHDISRSLMIFRHYLLFFYFFRTSLHKLAIKFRDKDASTIQFFHTCGISFDSRYMNVTFFSKISKFRTTSNLKITSKNIPRKQKKITEYSKPMNENIICYQGLSFQIWVDYKKIWTKEK